MLEFVSSNLPPIDIAMMECINNTKTKPAINMPDLPISPLLILEISKYAEI
jgi:hypothetical protein